MDATKRFSSRAELYAKYRPGYPGELYSYLCAEAGLRARDKIADLGSGTGLLSALFLTKGRTVYGIEPNTEMRAVAERQLSQEAGFVSIEGRAEAIPLEDQGVDFVVAGQAFHWFDAQKAKNEIKRILKKGGQVALVWNRRDPESSPIQRAYEDLLEKYGTDYKQVDQQRTVTDDRIANFFTPNPVRKAILPNRQSLDEAGLKGRLLSSSYAPMQGDANFPAMLSALSDLFARFQENLLVHFDYQTTVYHGLIH